MFAAGVARGHGSDASRDAKHFLVQEIRFGVFAEESAPGTATNERKQVMTPREFLLKGKVAQARIGGQHPLHHLRVGGGREIGAAEGEMRGDVLAWRGELEPRTVFLEGQEEFLQPAIFIAMLKGPRPHAKLFHVVAKSGDATGMLLGRGFEIVDGFLDLAEGDEISQLLDARKEPYGLAAIFGDVGAVEFFRLEARGKKRQVIHQGITDVGLSQRGGQLRLPNALGEPGPGGALAKMFFKIIRQAGELFQLIGRGDGDKDWLVKASANQFNLAGSNHTAQALEIFGMVLLDPKEQRAGIVEPCANARMFFEKSKEG